MGSLGVGSLNGCSGSGAWWPGEPASGGQTLPLSDSERRCSPGVGVLVAGLGREAHRGSVGDVGWY
jgi:hypothetical protein